MRPDMNPDIKPDDIAHYLQDHPEFFEQYADLLSLVTLSDPHSGRAISITEKQMGNLRDRVRAMERGASDCACSDIRPRRSCGGFSAAGSTSPASAVRRARSRR